MNVIAKLRARRDGNDESGFTLIELMVVVLIIAILIAIAIPTFLGARQRAQDKAAQSSLRNTLTAAKTIYTDGEAYTDATTGASGTLKGAEPSLSFVEGDVESTQPKMVSVLSVTDGATNVNRITLAAVSKGGDCFAMRDTTAPSATAGTEFAKITGDCDATTAQAQATGWSGDGW